jgi:predicted metal-dependent enzyme (double-stranded beta helix superfamily)
MNTGQGIPQDLLKRCLHWSREIASVTDSARRIDYFQAALPDLLRDRELFRRILTGMTMHDVYPDLSESTMFGNEIILFRDPGKEFSVRMYLWRQKESDPIHDHNSWGVIGMVTGSLEVTGYQRMDDGSDERHADLKENSRIIVYAGGTCPVLILNKGIHRTGNTGNPFTVVQVNVYGRNLTGRKYINAFDADTGAVSRLSSPELDKRELAGEALRGFYP